MTWVDHPRRFLDHPREIGAVRTPAVHGRLDRRVSSVPSDVCRSSFRAMSADGDAHGEDDESVTTSDGRQLAQAHGKAELSLLAGAGDRLRHDPRAIAILMGWLDRVRDA